MCGRREGKEEVGGSGWVGEGGEGGGGGEWEVVVGVEASGGGSVLLGRLDLFGTTSKVILHCIVQFLKFSKFFGTN